MSQAPLHGNSDKDSGCVVLWWVGPVDNSALPSAKAAAHARPRPIERFFPDTVGEILIVSAGSGAYSCLFEAYHGLLAFKVGCT